MIVKDEEAFLSQCLDSVRGLVDEIVVVDTGSSDRTEAIARRHGAKVRHVEWENDGAAARNESLRHAEGDWILVLDADETLDHSSAEEIRRLIRTDALVGYMLRIFSYVDRVGSASIVEHLNLRLFPNHPDLRYAGRAHAQPVWRRGDAAFRVVPCSAVIHHDGYRPQVYSARRKAERNRIWLEQAVREKPDGPYEAFSLGLAYYELGRDADAEQQLVRAIALSSDDLARDGFRPYLLNAYVTLALALYRQKRYEEAAEHCEAALRLAPDFADAYATLAAACVRLGRLEDALEAYKRARRCPDRLALSGTDRAAAGWKSLLGMAEVYLLQGRASEALACLERARELRPRDAAILFAIGVAHRNLGRLAVAERYLREAASARGAPADAWLLLAEVCLRHAGRDEAERVLREARARYPEDRRLAAALGRRSNTNMLSRAAFSTEARPWAP